MTCEVGLQKELRIACISDIHLGHRNNPTERIIANLNNRLNNSKFLSGIDILFLVGDVFDRLLTLESKEAALIDLWIASLLRRCGKLGVMVRVLEGTPGHDRKQSSRFLVNQEKIEKSSLTTCDLKYVDTLSIEYIEKFGIHVLYIPDEWSPDTQDTLDQVHSLLKEKGLSRVDFAMMHGMFEYQLPAHIAHIPRHDSIAYHGIVKHLIFIGHVHTFSRNDRITAQGSFDRLAHNEEEAKGFVKALIQPNGEYEIEFIENIEALQFVTIVCTHDDVIDNLLVIEDRIKRLKAGAHVRIQALHGNAILSNLNVVKERWPLFHWSLISKDNKPKEQEMLLDHKSIYVPLQLNRQNLATVMQERLQNKCYESQVVEQAMRSLNAIVRDCK